MLLENSATGFWKMFYIIRRQTYRRAIKGAFITGMILFTICVLTTYKEQIKLTTKKTFNSVSEMTTKNNAREIHISIAACGEIMRATEGLVALKSAAIFARSHLIFHIFADAFLQKHIHDELEKWPHSYKDRVTINIYDITYPEIVNKEDWQKVFKPCGWQRLFLPEILTNVDSLIYVDLDMVFLTSPDKFWVMLSEFNATQLISASADKYSGRSVPYYGKSGVNDGVMLMNLTRMRNVKRLNSICALRAEFMSKLVWPDQDLVNIYFHFHPDQLFLLSNEWNFRGYLCVRNDDVERSGVSILHGWSRAFVKDRYPTFKTIHQVFKQYDLSVDLKEGLLNALVKNLLKRNSTVCGTNWTKYTKKIESFLSELRTSNTQNIFVNFLFSIL